MFTSTHYLLLTFALLNQLHTYLLHFSQSDTPAVSTTSCIKSTSIERKRNRILMIEYETAIRASANGVRGMPIRRHNCNNEVPLPLTQNLVQAHSWFQLQSPSSSIGLISITMAPDFYGQTIPQFIRNPSDSRPCQHLANCRRSSNIKSRVSSTTDLANSGSSSTPKFAKDAGKQDSCSSETLE
jgi:hypothetical protein